MSKIIKAKHKISRSLLTDIWESDKSTFANKNYKPGQHGPSSSSGKKSEYGQLLRAKQILKSHYGRINERQFKKYFRKAKLMSGNVSENFISLLEKRLDVAVYRLNFANSIFAARQIVSHKHIKVNGKVVNIGSFSLNQGDKLEVVNSSRDIPIIKESLKSLKRKVPTYLNLDASSFSGELIGAPQVSEVPYPFELQIKMIVEFYSR